jgi:hypothetical protein
MPGIVYGLFPSSAAANEAVEVVRSRSQHAELDAFVHEGPIRDEDVQISGTAAVRWAAAGALIVGSTAAVIAALVLAPRADMQLGVFEFVLVFLGGLVFGVVAGAVAGASESKREIRRMAAGAHDGRVLVTVEAGQADPRRIAGLLEEQGALEVRAA